MAKQWYDKAKVDSLIAAGGGGAAAGGPLGYQKINPVLAVRMYNAFRMDANGYTTVNRLSFSPFYMAYGGNELLNFYMQVATAGSAGSVLRVGVYSAGPDGFPKTLLKDCGTIPITSPGGPILILNPGQGVTPPAGLHFLAAAIQGGTGADVARYVCCNSPVGGALYGDNYLYNQGSASVCNDSPYQNGVTGALPATATISGFENVAIYVAARVA
jgi:hypothetical protein